MNDSSLQTIHIFLPETQLETTSAGPRVECETERLAAGQRDREPRASSIGKRKKERWSLASGGESSHHRKYPTGKKSKQTENNGVHPHLHPLQDYLHPGLDGTPFFQWFLWSQIKLERKWCSVESSECKSTTIRVWQACAEKLYACITAQDACLQRLVTILRIRRTTFGAVYTAQVVPIDTTF